MNKSHGKDINLTCYLITISPYISGGGGDWNSEVMYLLLWAKDQAPWSCGPGRHKPWLVSAW